MKVARKICLSIGEPLYDDIFESEQECKSLAEYMDIDINDAITNKIDYNRERGRVYETM